MAYTFKVFDTEENRIIMENATASEITEKLNAPRSSVYTYSKNKKLLLKRYRVEKTGDDTGINKEEFEERWNEACKPFENVKWVKHGGRKLEI